ncbi:MAG: DUF4831 family protein [Paludibacteraceae bacterium]|nr:DUF4831 family protein [Paludibacteraceae bacterium]
MKTHGIFLSLLLLGAISLQAQIKEGESALIYYMPRTELVFEIEYEQITAERGMFYQYSERYLGTKDIVLENSVTYELKNVQLRTRTKADPDRAYTIPLNQKTLANCAVRLNNKGLIECINCESEATKTSEQHKPADCKQSKTAKPSLAIPFLEDQMLSGSIGKMAEGTAKQIYSIRENRLNLLAGEVEHTPADGTAMRLVLSEMDKQEEALTQLFLGKIQKKIIVKTVTLIPESGCEDSVIFRFSKHEGLVDSDDMSGEPFTLTIVAHKQDYAPAAEGDKQPAPSAVWQNLAGNADITLTDGEKLLVSKNIPVAQFGVAVPLAQELFAKRKTQVRFDTRTGSVIEIK